MSYILLKSMIIGAVFTLTGCQHVSKEVSLESVERRVGRGEFRQATQLIDSLKRIKGMDTPEQAKLDSLQDMMHRILLDFSMDQDQVKRQLSRYGLSDDSRMRQWEKTGKLEMRIIDGQKRYFSNAVPTLLFMSLVRAQGIPAKWQSGWMLHPSHVNLHDWCEVYYEGIGWVPVDRSFKLQDSEDRQVREFYIHGIDSYRLIVNDDYGKALYPAKKFPRSEPYDFQRGELEWDGGNLYFDKWSWDMEVEYETETGTRRPETGRTKSHEL